ncbi:MAG: hypothetical protein CML56_04565 [Rhodobacteraceae bacterium]|nr:hypothetical protein [Paracoccaceae bacterium]|tara:strand:- start:511 stop:720 length:210 start_codon:yes stop_codon:yes gene_type:complete
MKFFRIGDHVKKVSGDSDVGKTGEIVAVRYNAKGEIILSVQTKAVEWTRTLRIATPSWPSEDCVIIEKS